MRNLPAEGFSRFDEKSVVLTEQGFFVRETRHEKFLNLVITRIRRYHSVTGEYSPGICINDKNRPPACVKQNAVGCFRADTLDGKQLFSQQGCFGTEHSLEASAITMMEKMEKGFQPCCFHAKETGWSDEGSQFGIRKQE